MWDFTYKSDHHTWAGELNRRTGEIYLYCDDEEFYPFVFLSWSEALDWIKDWENVTYGVLA